MRKASDANCWRWECKKQQEAIKESDKKFIKWPEILRKQELKFLTSQGVFFSISSQKRKFDSGNTESFFWGLNSLQKSQRNKKAEKSLIINYCK